MPFSRALDVCPSWRGRCAGKQPWPHEDGGGCKTKARWGWGGGTTTCGGRELLLGDQVSLPSNREVPDCGGGVGAGEEVGLARTPGKPVLSAQSPRSFHPSHLRRVIYPCRSLCEAVQASCAPIMACYGYPWPAILHCGRFPASHGLCVAAVSNGSRLGRPRESPHGSQARPTGSALPSQATARRARGTWVSLVGETRDQPQQRVSERVKNKGPAGGHPQRPRCRPFPHLLRMEPHSAPPPSASRQLQGL